MFYELINFFLFFSLFFSVTFSIFPVGIGKLASVVIIFLLFLRSGRFPLCNRLGAWVPYLFLMILLMTYVSLVTTLNGVYDYSLVYLLFIHIIQFSIGGIYFASLYVDQRINDKKIMMYLTISGIFLSLFIFSLFISPGLRQWSESFIPLYGNIDPERITRIRGFSNGGGADHSIQIAITTLGACLLYLLTTNKLLKVISVIAILLTFCSNFFVARTGLLYQTIFLIIFLLYILRKNKKSLIFLGVVVVIFVVLFPVILNYADQVSDGKFSQHVLPWASQLFELLFSGKSNESNSELLKMLFLPDNIKIFLFGNGGYDFFGLYGRSDSGYVKMIFSFGIIITSLIVFFLILLSYFQFLKKDIVSIFLSVFILISLILTIKEPFILKIGTANLIYFSFYRFKFGIGNES